MVIRTTAKSVTAKSPATPGAWSRESGRAAVSGLALGGLALVGAVGLGAPAALVLDNALRTGDPGQDSYRLWLLTLLTLLPAIAVGVRWLAGRHTWASGFLAVAPAATGVAAVLSYDSRPPGTNHGIIWLALPMLLNSLIVARWVAECTRRVAGDVLGVPIATPYRTPAHGGSASGDRSVAVDGSAAGRWRRILRWAEWLLNDPATWRDVLWAALNACVGWGALLALAFAVNHLRSRVFGLRVWPILLVVLGAAALWSRFGWPLLRRYARFAGKVLGPTKGAELSVRVTHLARSRADTIDSGAAEMRRIERDLHDGAQARLVALGMTLTAAEQLFESSPEAARALLTEAKDSSVRALSELRSLVRGIHPPVLADRGLADAVYALALDLPLRISFSGELTERPPAPVESAAFFAVSELLANSTKHAAATDVWIELGHTDGMLRIVVTDNGRGGADPDRGTGLRGVERRLAAFDGVLAISSPTGGPTIATLEIPCG
ncbi:sensor histidine kinase [Kitasatospora viridis]|uniref:histidine kinase n=1 Tax=Kitasatospora viridis TaxID=281105 RepID=A0A561UI68_9ACTN|nr:histidine kinase [Kitasatospora viridis]TWF99047.1 signal transduction histidine kinase [Kitasatospora viridis]